MIINNRLDKSVGPQLSFSGWVLTIFGLIFITDVVGIILLITGFILATFVDGVYIDSQNKRIKKYSGPFGLAILGKWESVEENAFLTVVPMHIEYVIWSRSNRRNTSESFDFRVYLTDNNKKPKTALKICASRNEAFAETEKLASSLNLRILIPDAGLK
jgi:hypothetical protein